MTRAVRKAVRAQGEIRSHKLFAPPAPTGAIERKGLLDRIFGCSDLRLAVFQAPAGHGKSTLLQQVFARCRANGDLNGWLTLDEADNDIRRLQRHLENMLSLIGANDAATRLDAESTIDADAEADALWQHSDWFLNHLAQFTQPVNLFLDEFQQLADKRLLLFFRRVIEHLPPNCRLFIGSRSVPQVGVSRLVAHGRALVLTSEDLRFTPAEAEQFFSTGSSLDIGEEELEAIYRHTEGWPAALQLFRLSLPDPEVRRLLGGLDALPLPEIADYLADSVLAQQTPRVQDFLLRTSLLSNLSAGLCDAVVGSEGSGDLLRALETGCLFTRRLDSESTWFRYHSVFSSFLQAHLRATRPQIVDEVHRRAHDWYRSNGFPEEAMHHALALRNYQAAAAVLDGWASRLISGGYLATVERWADRLPLAEIEGCPDLAVKIAWALVFLRRHAKYRPVLDLLDRQIARSLPPKGGEPDIVRAMAAVLEDDLPRSFDVIAKVDLGEYDATGFRAFEQGAAANLLAFQAAVEGRFEDGRAHLIAARGLSKRVSALFSLGYAIGLGGMNLLQQGRLTAALDHLRQGMAEPGLGAEGSYAAAAVASIHCLALYEAGALDEAEAQFASYRNMLADATMVDFCAAAYLTMARIHDARGCPEQAAVMLEEAEEIGFAADMPRLVRVVGWEHVRRACLRREPDLAASHMSRIRPADPARELPAGGILFSDDTEGEAIGRIRLAIARGHASDALSAIGNALPLARRAGRVRRVIKLNVLEAAAHVAVGHPVLGQRALHLGLALAEPGGFVRPFLDEGDGVISLLRDQAKALQAAKAAEASAGFIERIIAASGFDLLPRPRAQGPLPLEPLTDRELEILRLLAIGVSNREMAERVFVSENTIKFHLKNIYSKLAVQGRIQAIFAARTLGVL